MPYINTIPAVSTVGNQTIAGIKTFSSSPVVPTPANGDNSTKIATTGFVAAHAPMKLVSTTIPVGVTVGPTGTFTTLRAAIDYMCATYSDNRPAGFKAYIQLDSNFVLNEHIVLTNVDLGWLTITSNGVTIQAVKQNTTTPNPATIWSEGLEHGTYNINTPTLNCFPLYNYGYGSCFVFIGCTAPTFWNITFEADASWTPGPVGLILSIHSTTNFYRTSTIGVTSEKMSFIQSYYSNLYMANCSISCKEGISGIQVFGGYASIESCTIESKLSFTNAIVMVIQCSIFPNCVNKTVGCDISNSRVTFSSCTFYENINIPIFAGKGTNMYLTGNNTVYSVAGGSMTVWMVSSDCSVITCSTNITFNFSARAVTNSNALTGIIVAQLGGRIVMRYKPIVVGSEPTLSGGAAFYKVSGFSTINIAYDEVRTTNITVNTVTADGVITK